MVFHINQSRCPNANDIAILEGVSNLAARAAYVQDTREYAYFWTNRLLTASRIGPAALDEGSTYTLNLTPMSHAVVSASTHRDANSVFEAPDLLDPVNPLDLIEATFTVLDWLLRLDPTILLPRDIDFVGGAFVPAPGDSQDAVLDLMQAFLDSSKEGKAIKPSIKYTRPAPMRADLPYGTLDD